MIKLFIIEDHATIIVSGLRNLFRPSRDQIEITGFATTLQEAITNTGLELSDIVILDLWIPGHDPLASLQLFREQYPGKPVIIYTSEELPLWQNKMMKAGAKGYVNKSCSRDDLKSAIVHVSKGGTWFTGPQATDNPEVTGNSPEPEFPVLSPAEKQIIDFLINGFHYKEISRKINISPAKIDKILAKLRNSYHCNTTIELVKLLSDSSLL
jgi:DNA-binding NarL/FixJ family response regulator